MKSLFLFIIFLLFCSIVSVWGQDMIVVDIYQEIEGRVMDIQETSLPGISEYGFTFAIEGMGGGIGYFPLNSEFEIHSIAVNLGAVSLAYAGMMDSIIVAFGRGGNSDGLYYYYPETEEFELINWYFFPHFVKKLDSGYYCGYGMSSPEMGLIYSEEGNDWDEIACFDQQNVSDIVEDNEGRLFVAADNFIYMQNGDDWVSVDAGLVVNDLYFRWVPHSDELYAACGDGTDSDGVYRIDYSDTVISIGPIINWFSQPECLYEYEGNLVVGCLEGNGLFLVEPVEMGEYTQIAQEVEFEDVYCFDFYPMYTPNFLFGTDNGIYLLYGGIGEDDNTLPVSSSCCCYPNPFNPETTISFSMSEASEVEIDIYSIKGQKVKTLLAGSRAIGKHSVVWAGDDDMGQKVGSGVYFIRLEIDDKVITRKAVLMK